MSLFLYTVSLKNSLKLVRSAAKGIYLQQCWTYNGVQRCIIEHDQVQTFQPRGSFLSWTIKWLFEYVLVKRLRTSNKDHTLLVCRYATRTYIYAIPWNSLLTGICRTAPLCCWPRGPLHKRNTIFSMVILDVSLIQSSV